MRVVFLENLEPSHLKTPVLCCLKVQQFKKIFPSVLWINNDFCFICYGFVIIASSGLPEELADTVKNMFVKVWEKIITISSDANSRCLMRPVIEGLFQARIKLVKSDLAKFCYDSSTPSYDLVAVMRLAIKDTGKLLSSTIFQYWKFLLFTLNVTFSFCIFKQIYQHFQRLVV